MESATKKQVIAVLISIGIVALLLSLNTSVLNTTGDGVSASAGAGHVHKPIDEAKLVSAAKVNLPQSRIQGIEATEQLLANAENKRVELNLTRKLALQWDSLLRLDISSLYYGKISEMEPSASNFFILGEKSLAAFRGLPDTVEKDVFLDRAQHAYEAVLDLDSTDIDAKAGLGICLVEGSGVPMQGIQLLLGVVEKDPNHFSANKSLGIFSMRTGQFDKAVQRLTVASKQKPDPEVLFFLGEAHMELGDNKKAFESFEKCKALVNNPEFERELNNYINSLKNI